MKYRVFIDGAEGTTGLKIHEYFQKRDDIEVIAIDPEKRKDIDERLSMIAKADVSFLCLPDAAAKEIAAAAPKDSLIIDTSTAHRTDDEWIYGLPELTKGQRDRIRGSKRIANPGCHATGAIVLIRPLIEAGIVPVHYPFAITSITGYSGGGKKMIAQYDSGGTGTRKPETVRHQSGAQAHPRDHEDDRDRVTAFVHACRIGLLQRDAGHHTCIRQLPERTCRDRGCEEPVRGILLG